MWTRSLLKTNAKTALKHNYWRTFFVCIVAGFFLYTSPTATVSASYGSVQSKVNAAENFVFVLAASLVIIALSIAFTFFLAGAIEVGFSRYLMENRVGNPPFSSLFSVFGSPDYWNVIKIMFMRSVYIFLWSLLFVIPGIIKSLEYQAIPYILSENPSISKDRAFALSRQMTNGEKGAIFVLDLSFFGWEILCMFTFGIGLLFLAPYVHATNAELYSVLRAKVFAAGASDEKELADFVRY